VEPP